MSRFSVKKPMTVLVAVVIVLVLGFVAFTGMTPDLLPNIDMPYIVLVTTYPGAMPEKVEAEVTKPLEQSMSTLEHIDTVSSTSSENYSMVILGFKDSVNMDTATVDILQKVTQLQGSWDDKISTPTMLKLNPSMLPVMVAAVEMDGQDAQGISDFVNKTLLNKLEGVSGVASVTASGLIEQTIDVQISQEKIDALNVKIREAIDAQFAENAQELQDAKAETEEQLDEIQSGKSALEAGRSELGSGADEELTTQQMDLLETKLEIKSQIEDLQEQLETLTQSGEKLQSIQDDITDLTAALTGLEVTREALEDLLATEEALEQQINNIQEDDTKTQEEKEAEIALIVGSTQYQQVMAGIADIAAQLGVPDTPREGIVEAIDAQEAELNEALSQIDIILAAQGLSRAEVASSLAEIEAGKQQINATLPQLQQTLAGLEDGSVELADARKTVAGAQTEGLLKISESIAQMAAGEAALNQALAEIDNGLEQMEDAKEDAYAQADANDIITMANVAGVLAAQNFSMPVGYVTESGTDYLVRVGDEAHSVSELENMALFNLKLDGVPIVRLSDVADVIVSDNADEVYTRVNGADGVLLSINKQSGASTAETSDNLRNTFEQLSEEYPGLHFSPLMDQGDYIYLMVESVLNNLLYGALFAILILFIFLWDVRPTFVIMCSIPISLLAAITLMYFTGVTLNVISLSGLAVAVGMLVDNSVVVIENIYRLRSEGESAVRAAVHGAKQVAGAIVSSTLTTICVFFPIVFVEGITRQLFTDMALTLAYALLASLIVALTLVPALSEKTLRRARPVPKPRFDKFTNVYRKSAAWTLRHKVVVLSVAVVLLAVSLVVGFARGFIMMPQTEAPQLTVSIEMPEGATEDETRAKADEVMAQIQQIDGVETVGAMAGGSSVASLMGFNMGSDNGGTVSMYVRLDEDAGVTGTQVAREVNARFAEDAAKVEAASSSMDMASLGESGVQIDLRGEDMDDLREAALQVADILKTVEGIADVDSGVDDTTPEIRFVVDKEKALEHGLTVAQIYGQLSDAMTTQSESVRLTIEQDDQLSEGSTYDVILLSAQAEDALTPDYIKNFELSATDEDGNKERVPIDSIASIQETETAVSISREDQQRIVSVNGALVDGYNVTLVTDAARHALEGVELPGGVTYEFTGENKTIMESMEQLAQMGILGILLVYLVMVAQFQSLKSPFIIMFTIPLAFTGGFLALAIAGLEVSAVAVVGIVMLAGIVVNNGIVLVDYINQLRLSGMERREAILQAGVTRMRPILMTSLTTILGLTTTAFAGGTSAAMMQPIAVVCIGGLAYATLLTLYVVPCIYDLVNRKELRAVSDEELDGKAEA